MRRVAPLRAILAVAFASIAIAIAGNGCGSKERREAASRAAGNGTREAPSTLVWGLSVQPDLLNPLLATSGIGREIGELVFLRLVEYGPPPAMDFVPFLAKSWEFSPDGRTLTYELRNDILWEDGRATTAADVAYTFEKMIDPDVAYPSKSTLRKIDSCVALGDWVVRFHFKEPPTEPLFETMFMIVPKHLLEGISDAELPAALFNRAPIGNGRWRVMEWVSDEKIVLVANPDTPLGRPGFDRLVFRIVPEDNTLRTELLTGGVDVIHRFPNRFMKEDGKNPALAFGQIPDRNYTYIGWNLKNPLFRDVRVRRALTWATDRATIVTAFRDGRGKVVAVPFYPEHADFNPNVPIPPFDPAAAASLLDEAGWSKRAADGIRLKDGRRFEFEFLISAGNTISEEIVTMVQQRFADLGIKVTARSLEWTVYLTELHKKEFDATVLARKVEIVYDPESVFHSRAIEGQYNDVSFSSPEIDALIDRAKSIPDREERRRVWWEFQERFAEEVPVTILYVGDAMYPVRRDKVENPVMDLRGALVRIHEWRPAGKTS